MSQNNMRGSFFPAVAGLFFFMNRTKNEDVYQSETSYPVYSKDTSGISGVSRYLQNKNASLMVVNQITEAKELISGVAKYLETLDQFPTSGVEKYILRKDVAEKKKKELSGETEVSGVEKYLKSLKPAKESTGVAKYMKSQSNLPQPSNVAKYLAKQAALSVLQDKTATIQISGVAKYLQIQDSLPQPSRVARYMAKQAAISALSAMQIKPISPLTGVAKYLDDQSNQPQISRVAKYMVRQALIEKQKPAPIVTGVEKYMRIQA